MNFEFLAGVKEKYPEPLLKSRGTVEGNVIGCFMQDPMLLGDCDCTKNDFITKDAHFYFKVISTLFRQGVVNFTEVDVCSISDQVREQFEEIGGWDVAEHMMNVISVQNFDSYLDTLYRENILLKMYDDGFNLLEPITSDNGEKKKPLTILRKMNAEGVIDWWESRLSTYGTGYSSKIIEEEEIDFTDEFLKSCVEGEETGVPFGHAGLDINGREINCYSYLSNQASGLLPGTLSMIGGFSSTGKSTWLVALIMALMSQDIKVILISNEENIKRYKIKFIEWLLYKRNRYINLTKQKLISGDIDEESMLQLKEVQKYWRENYKGKLKMVAINDADMSIVKKKIREHALRHNYDAFVYDTFKIQEQDYNNNRTDLSLVKDSRELDKLAKKYNMIGVASIQLAEYLRGTLFLSANALSGSKQVKEVLENLWLMRSVYPEELDKKSKYYCQPFRSVQKDDKWVEEPFDADPGAVWRILFVEKGRSGTNSSDNGVAYLLRFYGNYCVFKETAKCRPKHGKID